MFPYPFPTSEETVTTPDALAAFDPTAPAVDPSARVAGEVDPESMINATITAPNGGELITGTVTSWLKLPSDDRLHVTVREPGKTYNTAFTLAPDATFQLVVEAPQPDVVGVDPRLARELAQIQDAIKAHEGTLEELKERQDQITKLLLPQFQLAGSRRTEVDGRTVYISSRTFPRYLEKAPGEKYTAADAVAALRAIGRAHQIQPETVNYQTLGAILREYRDRDEELPAALLGIVELDEDLSVRVGAPKTKRRK